MANLVLTVVGDDRAGLVAALADVVSAHGGNWEHSELAELAGTFAGIVVVSVPDDRSADLVSALRALDGLLTVTAHAGTQSSAAEPPRQLTVNVLGNDHPGIVRDISAVLSRHGVSIERLTSESREAPMSGGRLFEARVVAAVPSGADPAGIQADLERLAAELLVDITLGE
ncbi:glycine cleavage system protein R [Propionicimonas sp.]|uniref:glycine cleavage system protein R n=1 Tax=Propionicimonas sp. TaxID=1955623 RepID=UPI0039E32477